MDRKLRFERAFLGRGWAFPVAPSPSGREVAMVDELEDIRQAVLLILKTEPGERLMRPEFGAGLRAMLHAVNNAATRALIRHRVEDALIRWEPRIDVDAIEVSTSAHSRHVIDIRIAYRVRRTNTFYNLVYPFYLQEERR